MNFWTRFLLIITYPILSVKTFLLFLCFWLNLKCEICQYCIRLGA
nr:MAG TPA: hypothetical protein [Caudoviricetes sp.]